MSMAPRARADAWAASIAWPESSNTAISPSPSRLTISPPREQISGSTAVPT